MKKLLLLNLLLAVLFSCQAQIPEPSVPGYSVTADGGRQRVLVSWTGSDQSISSISLTINKEKGAVLIPTGGKAEGSYLLEGLEEKSYDCVVAFVSESGTQIPSGNLNFTVYGPNWESKLPSGGLKSSDSSGATVTIGLNPVQNAYYKGYSVSYTDVKGVSKTQFIPASSAAAFSLQGVASDIVAKAVYQPDATLGDEFYGAEFTIPYTPPTPGEFPQNATVDGYRGIWFDLGQVEEGEEEYGSKYSGGLGSYSMKHIPMAIYAPAVNRTYFVYGGTPNCIEGKTTPEEQGRLLCMIGCYDHDTGLLQKPRIVMDKTATPLGKSDNGTGRVYDPHDNPTVQIDKNGYIFVFVSGRSTKRHGAIFRSRKPYDITSFETIKNDDFMGYPQVMYHPDKGFFLFFTRYDGTRRLFYRTSEDGINWPGPVAPNDSTQYESMKLASIHAGQTKSGHYQISNMWGTKICTAFNRHPNGTVNKRTNVYFLQTTDWGKTWTTADGTPVEVPVVNWNSNCLVRDYQHTTETHNCYIKDVNFDAKGNPLILYLTSRNHKSGPSGGTRQWHVLHWNGTEWDESLITTSTHNYDSGSIWVEGHDWVVLAPTDAGPQYWGGGGEVVRWRSTDEGKTWVREMTLTNSSRNNMTYVRRPWYGTDGFYAFWADGNTMTLSRSYLYFCNKAGAVFRMPYNMDAEWAAPEFIH